MWINVPISAKWNPLLAPDFRRRWQRRQLLLAQNKLNLILAYLEVFHHLSPAGKVNSPHFALAASLKLSFSQLLSSVTMGRLMAHPLGAVQWIWSPALATAICVCWRRNERKKRPAGRSPPIPSLSPCACAWAQENSNLVSAFHAFDLIAPSLLMLA